MRFAQLAAVSQRRAVKLPAFLPVPVVGATESILTAEAILQFRTYHAVHRIKKFLRFPFVTDRETIRVVPFSTDNIRRNDIKAMGSFPSNMWNDTSNETLGIFRITTLSIISR